jgi:hypothetical protein
MPMTEQDQQLLDAHLDDALSPIDAEHLRIRLAAEPDLAAALQDSRAERAVRQAAWQATESETSADSSALVDRVLRAGRAHERRRRLIRGSGAVAAAAACFAAGWFGRGVEAPQAVPTVARMGTPAPRTPVAGPGTFQVALTDAAGNVLAVQTFSQLDEARRFAADLTAWQSQQQQPLAQPGRMLLISDEF